MPSTIPDIALSVRQPWAWAIVAGYKVIENRSEGAIRAGGMTCCRIAIHAASAMTRKEYDWALWRLDQHGVRCPPAVELVRGAIIGAVDVVDIVSKSDSAWFGGKMGLVLENAAICDPIPAKGQLGYFQWKKADEVAPMLPWMVREGTGTVDMFSDLPLSFEAVPKEPFRD